MRLVMVSHPDLNDLNVTTWDDVLQKSGTTFIEKYAVCEKTKFSNKNMFRIPNLLYKCNFHQTRLLITAKTEHVLRNISGTVTPIFLHSLFFLCREAPYISVIQLMNRAHLTPCLVSNSECGIENGSAAQLKVQLK